MLPDLNYSDEECILEFKIWSNLRNIYPGACAIEFLSQIDILINKLIGWNIKEQKGFMEFLVYLLPLGHQ